MADENATPTSTKRPSPSSFWKELSIVEWVAIAVVIGYFFYLNQSTAYVVNFNNETQQVLYASNDLVPKSNVSNSQTFFGILLFIVCILILLSKRLAHLKRATPKEALDDLSKQLKELKNVALADGTSITIQDNIKILPTPQFITRYKELGEESKAFRYTFLVYLRDNYNEVTYYFRAWYHPWDRYWDGFYQTKTPIADRDRCPNCGSEYDIKVITTSDVQKAVALRKGLTGRP